MTSLSPYTRLVHSDWSISPRKRWAATAVREKTGLRVEAPTRVGDTELFLNYLREGPGPTLSGFDFPIGLPEFYGQKTRLGDFCSALDTFGYPPFASSMKTMISLISNTAISLRRSILRLSLCDEPLPIRIYPSACGKPQGPKPYRRPTPANSSNAIPRSRT